MAMTWGQRFQAGSDDPAHTSEARTRRLNTRSVLPQPLPEERHKVLFHTLSWFHPRTQTRVQRNRQINTSMVSVLSALCQARPALHPRPWT